MGQMIDGSYTDAFLVLKDGIVLAEEYHNGMGPDSLHLLNSVSKSFLGMLVGVLVDEGTLDPVAPLVTYLPEFADTAFRETSLRHALDMSGAVAYDEDYADRQARFWHETAVVGWRPALERDDMPRTLFDFACSLQDTEQLDGSAFHYRTVFTNVIAMAVERATGRSPHELVTERIWQPLRPEQDAAVVVDASGFPYYGAGMSACARDLARFGELLRQGGELYGERVVPEGWVRDTVAGTDEARDHFAASDYSGVLPGGHYRNQVWANAERGVMICIGIHGQTIHVNQHTGVTMVKLSTYPESADMDLFADMYAAMDALTESL